MSEQNIAPTDTKSKNGRLTAGIILISIGLGLLIFRLFSLEVYLTLALGLGLTIAGILTRKAGLIIPGGIIGGAGLGIVVMVNHWLVPMGSAAGGGVFLLVMSLGWFSITLLSRLFTDDTQIWPIFPGACMALAGGLALIGEQGLKVLEALGTFFYAYWPLILVVIGVKLLYRWWKARA